MDSCRRGRKTGMREGRRSGRTKETWRCHFAARARRDYPIPASRSRSRLSVPREMGSVSSPASPGFPRVYFYGFSVFYIYVSPVNKSGAVPAPCGTRMWKDPRGSGIVPSHVQPGAQRIPGWLQNQGKSGLFPKIMWSSALFAPKARARPLQAELINF